MIVLDTSVLVYAVGAEHPLREPCRRLIAAAGDQLEATTTVDVIQEFAHVRAGRRSRAEASRLARSFATVLTPLLVPTTAELLAGLALFEEVEELGCFDAVLAATAVAKGTDALVSADPAFSRVPGLRHVVPTSPDLDVLLEDGG